MFRNKAILWEAPIIITYSAGANAAIADVIVYVADADTELLEVTERHITKGSDGGAVTLDVVKANDAVALGSGTSMLASTFDLKSANDTLVRKNITAGGLATTATTRQFARGVSVQLNFGGTLTALAGLLVQLTFRRLSRPAY